jgi:hypothetical protein
VTGIDATMCRTYLCLAAAVPKPCLIVMSAYDEQMGSASNHLLCSIGRHSG